MDVVEVLRRELGRSVRRLVSGTTEKSLSLARDGSTSLFGPTSATWRVHADASMLVGGIRALLLQTLHPLVMAGVADHSAYREDPLGRLHRTAQFLGTTSYGSAEQAEAAIAAVRAVHLGVTGIAPDGRPYSALDPHLLAWVHLTEADSFLGAYQRFARAPLASTEADGYVAEMATIGARLGAVALPEDRASLALAIAAYRPELATSRQSRDALRFLLLPPLPLAARGPYGVLFAAAVGLLPGWARRQLWLPVLPLTEAVAVRGSATVLLRALGWALAPPATNGR